MTSRMMSRVRSKNSKPELALRRALHARGLRYRVHPRDVLGHPDVVNRSRRLAVFVDGDMWHGNEHHRRGLSSLAELFPTRTDWWVAKIEKNMRRDREVTQALREQGWLVIRLWASEVLADPDGCAAHVHAQLERPAPHRSRLHQNPGVVTDNDPGERERPNDGESP